MWAAFAKLSLAYIVRGLVMAGAVMAAIVEQDYEPGHPKRFDYDPNSPEAREWTRIHVHLKGERDFPVDHPKALDTKGNPNSIYWVGGVNPYEPQREAFTGRTPAQAAAVAAANAAASQQATETPARPALDGVKLNEALAAERKRLRVTTLSKAQYDAVLEKFTADTKESEE
jgi:hypothetical protein